MFVLFLFSVYLKRPHLSMFLLHFLICFIILSFIYMKISQTGDQGLKEADSRSRRQKKRV